MRAVSLNEVKHLTSPFVFYDGVHSSVSFTRNIETSVMYKPTWTIYPTLVGMSILLLASLHLSPRDPEITTILTSHSFNQELFKCCPLQDVITPILAPMAPIHPLIIIVPVSTIPMDTILMTIIPMDTIPMDTVPMDTVPKDTILMSIIPIDTIHMDTIPMDTIPMAMISMTMDPVIHHPIADIPKITIAGAMVHHQGTQKKEVQVKDTFPSNGDKLDMFTDSLH